jgi:hypothetical protein
MPIHEVPKINNHQVIFDLLESARRAGVISEFLLKWRGSARGFTPKVIVWSAASYAKGAAHEQLDRLLHRFIGSGQIVMLDD